MQKLTVVLLAILISLQAAAQMQIGVFAGIANYQGDLVSKAFQSPRAAAGLTFGYQLSSRVTLRAGLTFAKVAGADSLSSQADLKLRNLSFQSPITEFSLLAEFNTFDLDTKSWSPYVFGGLAVYHFNPYTFDRNGNKVMLQPLGTEGQGLPGYSGKPYALTQLAIPFGLGIKFNLNSTMRLAVEGGLRKLFTDYLDDVSGFYAGQADLLAANRQQTIDLAYRSDELPNGPQTYPGKGTERGSPKYKDYYYFTGLHLTVQLPEGNGSSHVRYGGPAKKRSGYGCPTVF